MLLQSFLTVLAMFVMMLCYSIWLTLAVCVFLVFMLFMTQKVGGASSRFMMAQQESLAKEEGFVEEMLNGQKVIQVFCHEEESKSDFVKINDQLFSDSEKAFQFGNILMPILNNVGNLMYVSLAIIGGLLLHFQVDNLSLAGIGTISVGIIISFLGMARQLSQTIGQASMQVSLIAMGLAGAKRVFQLMDEKSETDQGYVTLVKGKKDEKGKITETDEMTGTWFWKQPDKESGQVIYRELTGDIRLEHVDFGYEPRKLVLRNISLFAKPGQKIAFVGATGAGKTTITNLINRFMT